MKKTTNTISFFLVLILFASISHTLAQTKLVGTTASSGGKLFRVNEDGTNPEVLKDFTVGKGPNSSLLESNEKFWGMTTYGGRSGVGVIFSMEIDGTGYSKVHEFDDINGSNPYGSLMESNGKLWGMTKEGGSSDFGVIFSLEMDGTGYTVIHNFDNTNGRYPHGSLMESSGKLWGMTKEGGTDDFGVIFSMDTDGTGYTVVHNFDNTNGSYAYGNLMESNGKLWGMTKEGGSDDFGVIFSLTMTGTTYDKVHDFVNANGSNPYSNLIESNGKLLGMTAKGGSSDNGVIFSMTTEGTEYTVMHDFDYTTGGFPYGSLLASNGKLWGTTEQKGDGNYYGVVFSINSDGTEYTVEHSFENNEGGVTHCSLIESSGRLWGLTNSGGEGYNNYGVIFSMNTDGTDYVKEHDFGNTSEVGPMGILVEHNGKLWGMAKYGGSNRHGVIFLMNVDGTGYTVVHNFDGTYGSQPEGGLVKSNGKFWGMTNKGGSADWGVIFSLNMDGGSYTKVHDFDSNTTGKLPEGNLVESNGKFWGIASYGGNSNHGVLFSINTDGTNFEKVHDFDKSTVSNGKLEESNSKLWGITTNGGNSDYGVIFSINTNGTGYTEVHDFDGINGSRPEGGLVESNGKLWGMTVYGGNNDYGVIFSINTDGTGYTKEHDFDKANGSYPTGILVESNGKLWGMTHGGGNNEKGVIFSIDLEDSSFTKILDLTEGFGNSPYWHGALLPIGSKDAQEIKFSLDDKTYGDVALTLSATSNSSNTIMFSSSDENVISISGNTATVIEAGDATITASQEKDDTYFAGYAYQTISVNKAELVASADDQMITYGEDIPTLTVSYDGFVNGEDVSVLTSTPTINTSATNTSNAGIYDITINGGVAENYDVTPIDGTLTISKAELVALADDQMITYGDNIPTLTVSYVGFVNGDNLDDIIQPSISTDASVVSEPGTYDIILSGGSTENYELRLVNGVLTIENVVGLINKEQAVVLKLYPNPVKECLKITDLNEEIKSVEIFDVNGKQQMKFIGNHNSYDISSLIPASYIIIVRTFSNDYSLKLIKE